MKSNYRPLRAGMLGLLGGLAMAVALASPTAAQDPNAPPITDLPRNETLIINNPEGPASSPGNFNLWVAGNGAGNSTGSASAGHGHAVVHGPREGPRRLALQRADHRPLGVQRRLHRNDRPAEAGHQVERRRRLHLRRRQVHRRHADRDAGPHLVGAASRLRSKASTRPTTTPCTSSSRSPMRGSTPSS